MQPCSDSNDLFSWKERNCDKCKLYENESIAIEWAGCKLAFSLYFASYGDGEIEQSIAEQIGLKKNGELAYRCKLKASLREKKIMVQKDPELELFN